MLTALVFIGVLGKLALRPVRVSLRSVSGHMSVDLRHMTHLLLLKTLIAPSLSFILILCGVRFACIFCLDKMS